MWRKTALLVTGAAVAMSLSSWAEDSGKKISAAKSIEGTVVRASEGMAVKSPAGKDLGKVEDVVIDMNSGKIRYAAISFGGFLGFGEKLFAVPFKVLHVRHEGDSKAPHFEMNVDRGMLEKAKGFDKKNWPDFADPRFAEENDPHFAQVSRVK